MNKHGIASVCALVVCCYALARPAVAEFTGNTGPTVRSAEAATRGLGAGSSRLDADADAVGNLQQNSNQGDVDAMNRLGIRYARGRGVAKNYAIARKWFRRSALQGYAPADSRVLVAGRAHRARPVGTGFLAI
jgi:TPR repeat protein